MCIDCFFGFGGLLFAFAAFVFCVVPVAWSTTATTTICCGMGGVPPDFPVCLLTNQQLPKFHEPPQHRAVIFTVNSERSVVAWSDNNMHLM